MCLIKKACFLLVLIKKIYHNSRFKNRKVYVHHIITRKITEYQYPQPCILHTLNIVLLVVVNKLKDASSLLLGPFLSALYEPVIPITVQRFLLNISFQRHDPGRTTAVMARSSLCVILSVICKTVRTARLSGIFWYRYRARVLQRSTLHCSVSVRYF
jgi:hypothetical protein